MNKQTREKANKLFDTMINHIKKQGIVLIDTIYDLCIDCCLNFKENVRKVVLQYMIDNCVLLGIM